METTRTSPLPLGLGPVTSPLAALQSGTGCAGSKERNTSGPRRPHALRREAGPGSNGPHAIALHGEKRAAPPGCPSTSGAMGGGGPRRVPVCGLSALRLDGAAAAETLRCGGQAPTDRCRGWETRHCGRDSRRREDHAADGGGERDPSCCERESVAVTTVTTLFWQSERRAVRMTTSPRHLWRRPHLPPARVDPQLHLGTRNREFLWGLHGRLHHCRQCCERLQRKLSLVRIMERRTGPRSL